MIKLSQKLKLPRIGTEVFKKPLCAISQETSAKGKLKLDSTTKSLQIDSKKILSVIQSQNMHSSVVQKTRNSP